MGKRPYFDAGINGGGSFDKLRMTTINLEIL
jgi:hypothetical protein